VIISLSEFLTATAKKAKKEKTEGKKGPEAPSFLKKRAKMFRILSNSNENFFAFFAFAVKKFLWVKFSTLRRGFLFHKRFLIANAPWMAQGPLHSASGGVEELCFAKLQGKKSPRRAIFCRARDRSGNTFLPLLR
jgi:hypothetical protein